MQFSSDSLGLGPYVERVQGEDQAELSHDRIVEGAIQDKGINQASYCSLSSRVRNLLDTLASVR